MWHVYIYNPLIEIPSINSLLYSKSKPIMHRVSTSKRFINDNTCDVMKLLHVYVCVTDRLFFSPCVCMCLSLSYFFSNNSTICRTVIIILCYHWIYWSSNCRSEFYNVMGCANRLPSHNPADTYFFFYFLFLVLIMTFLRDTWTGNEESRDL